MTYREVRRGMDPERWKGRRRAAVLGRWRELKLMMWDEMHRECPDEVPVATTGVPAATDNTTKPIKSKTRTRSMTNLARTA